jgi:hypothetical protein
MQETARIAKYLPGDEVDFKLLLLSFVKRRTIVIKNKKNAIV